MKQSNDEPLQISIAKSNAMPGNCMPGLSVLGLPVNNFTGVWKEVCEQDTEWEEAINGPNYITYCKT